MSLSKPLSEVLGEAHITMDKDSNSENISLLLSKLHERLVSVEKNTENIEKYNKCVNSKIDKIDNNVKKIQSEVSKIQTEMSKLKNELLTLKTQVSGMTSDIEDVKKRNREMEKSVETVSDLYDDMKKTTEEKFKELIDAQQEILEQAGCNEVVKELEKDRIELQKEREQLHGQIEDLQWRSMKNNLIFTGLFEEQHEDTEAKLRQFLYEQLGINWHIEFGNVHRFQKPMRGKRRPIVARFLYNKDRQTVKDRAYNLRNTRYGISEQLPESMEDRRRELIPILRQQRALGRRTKLVRDKLIVNGRLYVPGEPEPRPPREPQRHSSVPRENRGQQSSPSDRDRLFDDRQYSEVAGSRIGEKRRRPSSETSVKGPPSARARVTSPTFAQPQSGHFHENSGSHGNY